MKDKLKQWGWVIVLGIVTLLGIFLGKPSWVKELKNSIKEREREIDKIQKERQEVKKEADEIKATLPSFNKVVTEQDEKIAEAGKVKEVEPITDPSNIADFIKERASRRK